MYEDSWTTNTEEQIKASKEMIKKLKGLILIRGGANFYHYDHTIEEENK